MTNSSVEKKKETDELCLPQNSATLTCQGLVRSLSPFRNPKVVGSTPTTSLVYKVQASRSNHLGAFSFSGLLRSDPQDCVSERVFVFPGESLVGVGSDEACAPCQSTEESKKLILTSRVGLRNAPVLFRRAIFSRLLKKQATVLCGLLFLLGTMTSLTPSAFAEQAQPSVVSSSSFSSFNCIKALVGEVDGESYQTKLATAECLRNRGGSLKGVYGIHSKRIALASKKVWADSKKAWEQSASTDLVRGATVWGSDSDVKKWKSSAKKHPRHWFNSFELVRKIGGHSFFKLKTKKKGAK